MAYSAKADIDAIFGETNVAMWSNLENVSITSGVPTADTSRIADAIEYADGVIDDRFRGSRYSVPFSSVPVVLKNWSATLAGVWLFRSRGFAANQDSEETNRYAGMEANVLREMDLYLANTRRLDLPESHSRPTAPIVVI